MSDISYKLPEWAFDEVIELLERIEAKAENLKKMCRKRSHFHVCEIRSHAFDFCNMAKNIREYLCDQIADQVQYTLTIDGLAYAALKGIPPERLVIEPLTGEILDVSEIDPATGLKREEEEE